jgi:hypothetical protein
MFVFKQGKVPVARMKLLFCAANIAGLRFPFKINKKGDVFKVSVF